MTCQQFKASSRVQQPWQELPPANLPMESVSVGLTDMGSGAVGQKYVSTVIYHFSRFVNLHTMSTRTAENVGKKLDMVVESFGTPKVLLADKVREFCSDKLKSWCRETGVRLIYSTPYHPQDNSISKRIHRTLKAVLSTLSKGQPALWPQYIKKRQRVLNSAVHEATGEQPHFLMFNRRARRLIGMELPQLGQDPDLEVALEVVKRTNIEPTRKWRNIANLGRKNQRVEVDHLMWLKRDYTSYLSDRKLGLKWVGPYQDKEVLQNEGRYRLEKCV